MTWEVEYTDQFRDWWNRLGEDDQEDILVAVEYLREHGPMLGRPFVDNIHRSRHPNMKELRPQGTSIRVLFAFDPRRTAILLIGGDKSGSWRSWYERMIPVADRLYDDHLDALRREGEIP